MKISVIDIGTQSVKHYIFEITGSKKETIFYKRYSHAHLGDNDEIKPEVLEHNISLLKECFNLNKEKQVETTRLLGTDILRKAKNASIFLDRVKKLAGCDVQVISQDLEAQYLYEGFLDIVPADFYFAALNIGGGSTEIVLGDSRQLDTFIALGFGVKFLRERFVSGEKVDWEALDAYLDHSIATEAKSKRVFITGALDFISTAGPSLGVNFDISELPHHPFSLSLDKYDNYIATLRQTSIDKLKLLYPKDPGFCDNLALGQSVYLMIAKKLHAHTIIPSRNDLTDGVIYRAVNSH